MIEANPRLWGPSQLILDSGMGLFHAFLQDCGFLHAIHNKEYKTGIRYFWSGGIIEDSINDLKVVFHGNYDHKMLVTDFYKWYSNEIFLREDTMQIFFKEHSHG
jgi:hypothetical protein